jgi:hypothetical protein
VVKIPKKIHGYKVIVDNKHKYYGTTDTKAKTVIINKKKSLKAGGEKELRDTISHERAHVENPQASERQIEKEHKTNSLRDIGFRGLI